MAVASSSFQPSRIGFGSIIGAPLPAGRVWKEMWDALVELGEPIRPSTVPPTTCQPFFRRASRMRLGSKRNGRDETLSKVAYAPFLAFVIRTCSRPPDFFASGRVGWANRRSRSTACARTVGAASLLAATRDFLALVATFLTAVLL